MKCIIRKWGLIIVFIICSINNSYAVDKLLQQNDLVYVGAFRVPTGDLGGGSLKNGGRGLTFNPIKNSLFIMGSVTYKKTAEISIPEIVNSTNISDLKIASVLQTPIDLTGGKYDYLSDNATPVDNGGMPGSFLVYKNKLLGTAWAYYDASGYQGDRSHFTASPNWSTDGTQFSGMYAVGVSPMGSQYANGGFVGNYMMTIPTSWQSILGGPVLTGQGAIPIVGRTSWGPSLWVFDPDNLGVGTPPVPATMLVGYPENHHLLGDYSDSPNLYFNKSCGFGGAVFPENSDSVLIFGNYGLGTYHDNAGTILAQNRGDSCYGESTQKISEARTNGWLKSNSPSGWTCGGKSVSSTAIVNGDGCCYDLVSSDKGGHAYPYTYRVWVYDANDIAKVKSGAVIQSADLSKLTIGSVTGQIYRPWNIKPYSLWNLSLPFASNNKEILGAAYDSLKQRIYIAQTDGFISGIDRYPVIHVFEIKTGIATPSAPTNVKSTVVH